MHANPRHTMRHMNGLTVRYSTLALAVLTALPHAAWAQAPSAASTQAPTQASPWAPGAQPLYPELRTHQYDAGTAPSCQKRL